MHINNKVLGLVLYPYLPSLIKLLSKYIHLFLKIKHLISKYNFTQSLQYKFLIIIYRHSKVFILGISPNAVSATVFVTFFSSWLLTPCTETTMLYSIAKHILVLI